MYVKKGSTTSVDPLDQIKEVTDNIDGVMDINSVGFTIMDFSTNEETTTIDTSKSGRYSIRYTIKDSSGNEGWAWGGIAIYDLQYNTTITNNTLPTLDFAISNMLPQRAYIVPAGTAFDPANPGTVKPRFIKQTEPVLPENMKLITD